jgi:hypothetical protein
MSNQDTLAPPLQNQFFLRDLGMAGEYGASRVKRLSDSDLVLRHSNGPGGTGKASLLLHPVDQSTNLLYILLLSFPSNLKPIVTYLGIVDNSTLARTQPPPSSSHRSNTTNT